MKEIRISDVTVGTFAANSKTDLTFREKVEVAKLLDRLGVSVIELGTVSGDIAEGLLIKTVAASVGQATLAVCPELGSDISRVWDALKEAKHPRLQICVGVSTARMEYVYHKKADSLVTAVAYAIEECKKYCDDVEFIAEDATRADADFLAEVVSGAVNAGATTVTVCDTAGVMLPDEFAAFVKALSEKAPEIANVTLGVKCSDALGVANAAAVAAIGVGAGEVKVSAVESDNASLATFAKFFSVKGDALGITSTVSVTEINRVLKSIERLCEKNKESKSPFEDGVRHYPEDMVFTEKDDVKAIENGAKFLGYELDSADVMRVFNAFSRAVAKKERVTIGELEAIIASEAMQVAPTFTLENYIITTGNAIDILAHVKLRRGEKVYDGLSLGDGPIDAAFLAIEKITGHHYELDDFQIQAITEGHEAMGQTVVKLRSGGKVYAGRGLNTDILGSAIAAYVNALNKILYEEENT